ncbi:MAG: DMT family transporter [Clostridia bacterium]|nr:DMT family transporter [Clostridia bacterium]
MYGLLSLLNGVLIAAMIVINGNLTGVYGPYSATLIIHLAGMALIAGIVLLRKERPFSYRPPLYLYLGGAIGVFTTVFENMAFGKIPVASQLALGLLGQSVMGLTFDTLGLLGMPKRPIHRGKLLGIALVMAGIISMSEEVVFLPMLCAFAGGMTLGFSRVLVAGLSEHTSYYTGSFFNYLVGTLVCIPVVLLLGRGEPAFAGIVPDPRLWIYTGGMVGVCVVTLSSVTVKKISAFYLTLFLFLGQVFTGQLFDVLFSGVFNPRCILGGVLVAAGLIWNLWMDHRLEQKSAAETEPV